MRQNNLDFLFKLYNFYKYLGKYLITQVFRDVPKDNELRSTDQEEQGLIGTSLSPTVGVQGFYWSSSNSSPTSIRWGRNSIKSFASLHKLTLPDPPQCRQWDLWPVQTSHSPQFQEVRLQAHSNWIGQHPIRRTSTDSSCSAKPFYRVHSLCGHDHNSTLTNAQLLQLAATQDAVRDP